MGLDIRLPLGLVFFCIGMILVAYGLYSRGSAIYAMSDNINLNLVWGSLMTLFGVVMYLSAKRAARAPKN